MGIVRLEVLFRGDLDMTGLWTDLEGHTGLWVCCFPAIPPCFRYISHVFNARLSTKDTRTTYPTYELTRQHQNTPVRDSDGNKENIIKFVEPSLGSDSAEFVSANARSHCSGQWTITKTTVLEMTDANARPPSGDVENDTRHV